MSAKEGMALPGVGSELYLLARLATEVRWLSSLLGVALCVVFAVL